MAANPAYSHYARYRDVLLQEPDPNPQDSHNWLYTHVQLQEPDPYPQDSHNWLYTHVQLQEPDPYPQVSSSRMTSQGRSFPGKKHTRRLVNSLYILIAVVAIASVVMKRWAPEYKLSKKSEEQPERKKKKTGTGKKKLKLHEYSIQMTKNENQVEGQLQLGQDDKKPIYFSIELSETKTQGTSHFTGKGKLKIGKDGQELIDVMFKLSKKQNQDERENDKKVEGKIWLGNNGEDPVKFLIESSETENQVEGRMQLKAYEDPITFFIELPESGNQGTSYFNGKGKIWISTDYDEESLIRMIQNKNTEPSRVRMKGVRSYDPAPRMAADTRDPPYTHNESYPRNLKAPDPPPRMVTDNRQPPLTHKASQRGIRTQTLRSADNMSYVIENQKTLESIKMERLQRFYATENRKTLESIKMELAEFLRLQGSYLPPSIMEKCVARKLKKLMEKFKSSLLGHETAHLLEELEAYLKKEKKEFCSRYTKRFTTRLGLAAVTGIYTVMGVVTVLATGVGTITAGALITGVTALVGRSLRLKLKALA